MGKKILAENYLPLFLLWNILEVFDKLIYEQLISYFEKDHLIHDRQYGFRYRRSSAGLLTCASQVSKAFDRVWDMLYLKNYHRTDNLQNTAFG